MPSRPSRSLAAVPPAHAHRRPVVHAKYCVTVVSILVDLYTELSRQEIGHTILVTHLDRLKYRKNSSRCHKIKYRKVRRF